MDIKIPIVPECYNVKNYVDVIEPLSESTKKLFKIIQECINGAFTDGYKTGYTDGVASVKGGAING